MAIGLRPRTGLSAELGAVFLDKDGTLVRDLPYNVNPDLLDIRPDVAPALRALSEAGFLLVIVSNQSGIGRGYCSREDVETVNLALLARFANHGVAFDAVYFCPHAPSDGCDCRKPAPGLLLRAAGELQLDLKRSWMVGDILDDVEAGRRAGCRTILLNNGGETEWKPGELRTPAAIVSDFAEAVQTILSDEEASCA